MIDTPLMIVLPAGSDFSSIFSQLSHLGSIYGGAAGESGSLASLGSQYSQSQPQGGSSSLVQPTAPMPPVQMPGPGESSQHQMGVPDAPKTLLGAGVSQSSQGTPFTGERFGLDAGSKLLGNNFPGGPFR